MAQEIRVDKHLAEFSETFAAEIAFDGPKLSKKHIAELQKFTLGHKDLIEQAVLLAPTMVADAGKLKGKMRDRFIADVQAEVWKKRRAALEPGKTIYHGDGLDISDRVWRVNDLTKKGLNKVVANRIRFGKAVDSSMYSMQYWVEEQAKTRFAHYSQTKAPGWLKDLKGAGRVMIENPNGRKYWNQVLDQVEGYVARRARNGTHYAGKQLIREVKKAVATGKGEMIDKAVRYWLYDRQKYFLKRIVRTEAATAFHVSQIQATENDPALIGYQWRLSSAHPRVDICDEWARVDQGLGAGVWSKDRVPRGKAHPHCMCYLLPRFGGKDKSR